MQNYILEVFYTVVKIFVMCESKKYYWKTEWEREINFLFAVEISGLKSLMTFSNYFSERTLSASHCTLCFAGPCWVRAQIRDCHQSKIIAATVLKNRACSYQVCFFPSGIVQYFVELDPMSSFLTIHSVGGKSQTWVEAGNYYGLTLPQALLYKSFRTRD